MQKPAVGESVEKPHQEKRYSQTSGEDRAQEWSDAPEGAGALRLTLTFFVGGVPIPAGRSRILTCWDEELA